MEIWVQHERGQLRTLDVHADLFDDILREKLTCQRIARFRGLAPKDRSGDFRVREDWMLLFRDRIVVSDVDNL